MTRFKRRATTDSDRVEDCSRRAVTPVSTPIMVLIIEPSIAIIFIRREHDPSFSSTIPMREPIKPGLLHGKVAMLGRRRRNSVGVRMVVIVWSSTRLVSVVV